MRCAESVFACALTSVSHDAMAPAWPRCFWAMEGGELESLTRGEERW
jgi:hypothetical protein